VKKNNSGFTLIELIIVITILGILAALISGNFITSLKKGRDAKRKTDLGQIQKAAEMYYEDKGTYPASITFGSKLCETVNCVGGEKVYMQKIPDDPISGNSYQYETDVTGSYYRLFSCIENSLDEGNGVSQTGYTGGPDCGNGACEICKYYISDSNSTPLVPVK